MINLKKIGKFLGILLAAYVLYVIAFAVFPYIHPKEVSEEFKSTTKGEDFFAETECTDRVALVERPIRSLDARLYLINCAEKTLDISYFAVSQGASTDAFFAEILHAADRGVQVRLLFDGMSGNFKDNKAMGSTLASHPNIQFVLYNTIHLLKPWTFNGRLHDKYILVDNKFLLLGGRNIGDHYFGLEDYTGSITIDRDVLVFNTGYEKAENRDSVVYALRKYMDEIWNGENVTPFPAGKASETEKELARLRGISLEIHGTFNEEEIGLTDEQYSAMTFPANKVSLITNDTHIYPKEPKVMYAIASILSQAKQDVLLQSPYIVPDRNIMRILEQMGQTKASYRILTNSLASSPNIPAFSAYTAHRDEIIQTGADIYEFQSRHSIHSKTYLADDRMSIVGSCNLDPRSLYIDTELMLVIDSRGFTQQLRQVIGEYEKRSLIVGEDGDYLENADLEPFPVAKWKEILIKAVSIPASWLKFLV